MILVLNNSLVVIDELAFAYCTSLECITVPPTVMTINEWDFLECTQLRGVILQNGLKKIESCAFASCRSIESIKIPPSVTAILVDAFEDCSNLTRVVFCDMIEKFVSKKLMKYWWNQGVHEKYLSTYCFLVQCKIPMSMENLTQNMWHINIHHMLQRIPLIADDIFFICILIQSVNTPALQYIEGCSCPIGISCVEIDDHHKFWWE